MKNKTYKPWLNGKVPNGYWVNEDNRKEALKWLIEEKLDIFNTDNKLTREDFVNNGLDGIFRYYFNRSIKNVFKFIYPRKYNTVYEYNRRKISTNYPDDYKPWINGRVPKNYWKDENNIRKALEWLVAKYPDRRLTVEDFANNNLRGLLYDTFNNSIFKAEKFLYPYEKIYDTPWLIEGSVMRGYWSDESNIRKALKWLFEDKLDIANTGHKVTREDFVNNGLGGLLSHYFHNTISATILFMYPETPWIYSRIVPVDYWDNRDNMLRALKWLFENKLDIANTGHKVTRHDFVNNGLGGFLRICFNHSVKQATDYYDYFIAK